MLDKLFSYQQQYHEQRLFLDDKQDMQKLDIYNRDIITQCIDYFVNDNAVLLQPAKSYCVAFIYSKLLENLTDITWVWFCSNQNFLFDDIFFLPYGDETAVVYNMLNTQFTFESIVSNKCYNVQTTIKYCFAEFNIELENKRIVFNDDM